MGIGDKEIFERAGSSRYSIDTRAFESVTLNSSTGYHCRKKGTSKKIGKIPSHIPHQTNIEPTLHLVIKDIFTST